MSERELHDIGLARADIERVACTVQAMRVISGVSIMVIRRGTERGDLGDT
ncbi:MAG TPA: DUF1127 domain-containing protein [Burkholderiales bacterium]|nr:DUF1127 domain-containing protein [Burkholderiales bacterium]